MWLQWFSIPSPVGHVKSHDQAQDGCFGTTNFEACLKKYFNALGNPTENDVLLIRGGLEYLIYSTDFVKQYNVDKLPSWKNQILEHLPNFISELKKQFKGTIVWLLLTPFGSLNEICAPPLRDAGELIPEANQVIESILRKENITFIDPTIYSILYTNKKITKPFSTIWKPFNYERIGYYDCVHPAEPFTSLTLHQFLKILFKKLKL